MPDKVQMGERIKAFRLSRNRTLKEVELAAHVSATHVSEIERGMTSPTVGALTKIARALGTEPSYFLKDEEFPPVSVVRRDSRQVLEDPAWGARLKRLCQGISNSEMSFLEIELAPGGGDENRRLTHLGEEFIYVLKGVVEVHLGLDRHVLKEGDSFHYRATEPHSARNIGDGPARMLWVGLPPYRL